MVLITPEDDTDHFSKEFERVYKQLRSFLTCIEDLQQRVQTGEGVKETEVRKLFQDLRGWLKLAHDAEKLVAERNREKLGIKYDYGLDLRAAHDQIGCRLDRLRRCCGQGKIPK